MKETAIAIIGAGASGIISLYQIVDKFSREMPANKRLRIFLFDKSGVFGTGVAYSTPLASHLLNVRASSMSAVSGEPLHFWEWLESVAPQINDEYPDLSINKDTFVPRKVYGRYLTALFHETVARAKQCDIRIEFIKSEVTQITDAPEGIELILVEGKTLRSHFLILAIGNFPSTLYSEFRGTPGYIPYPWPARRLMEEISPTRPVCILGAGLSAVDTLFTLLENGHKGKIYFLSRKGLLPKVQCKPADYDLRFVTRETLSELTDNDRKKLDLDAVGRLFIQEIETAEGEKLDWLDFLNPQGDPGHILARDIRRAESGVISNQAALMATRPLHAAIWHALTPEDQKRFDREYKSVWNHYRVPLSVINAKKALAILKSGQLTVLGGIEEIRHISPPDRFRLRIGTRLGPGYHLEVPFLINATGQGLNVTRFEDRFISNLLTSGIISPHHSGGIRVDFNSCAVIDRDGKTSSSVFAVGELTRGVHLFTNAISENVKYADRITDILIANIVKTGG